MNHHDDTLRLDLRPEVQAFVAAVRGAFADLDPEGREELLDGLEADVSEFVADRGPQALGDPVAYARELRSAAGLPEAVRPRRPGVSPADVAEALGHWLDRSRDLGVRALDLLPWGLTDAVRVVRPAWWLARAWALVTLVNIWLRGANGAEFLPTGSAGLGVAILLLAGLASVQVGRRAWWPRRAALGARLVVLTVNAVALVALPGLALDAHSRTYWEGYDRSAAEAGNVERNGLWLDGRRVCNLQPFDAQGRQVIGVQLFDQSGRAVEINCNSAYVRRHRVTNYPWLLGDVARWNVFPQAERLQRGDARGEVRPDAYDDQDRPGFPDSDRTTIPAVTHPLVVAEEQDATRGRAGGAR